MSRSQEVLLGSSVSAPVSSDFQILAGENTEERNWLLAEKRTERSSQRVNRPHVEILYALNEERLFVPDDYMCE